MTGNRTSVGLAGAAALALALGACAATGTGDGAASTKVATNGAGQKRTLTPEEGATARNLASYDSEAAAVAAARAAGPAPGRVTIAILPDRMIAIADDARVTRAYLTTPTPATPAASSAPSRPPPPPK